MKVSVIVTTYRHSMHDIDRAIKSVLDQVTPNWFEIILINDNELHIACAHRSRVNIINTGHIGMMRAYQMGFNAAKGKYITFCDGDDYWNTNQKLQIQIEYMEANPDCGVCFTKVMTEDGNNLTTMKKSAQFINNNISFDSLLRGNAHIHAQGYFIRRSTFEKYIDFNKFIRLGFRVWDYPIVLELIHHTRFHCLDFHSAVFVKSEESATQTRSRKKRASIIYGNYRIKWYYILKYGCKLSTILILIYYLARRTYSLIFRIW